MLTRKFNDKLCLVMLMKMAMGAQRRGRAEQGAVGRASGMTNYPLEGYLEYLE